MRQAVTVSLPEDIAQELDKLARTKGVSCSDFIRESVRDYLFIRKFAQLRKRLMMKASAQESTLSKMCLIASHETSARHQCTDCCLDFTWNLSRSSRALRSSKPADHFIIYF